MTIDLKTISKIREMDAVGVPKRQISQKLGVALNTVMKYTKDEAYEGQQIIENKEDKKTVDFNRLEEELQLASLKPQVEEHLYLLIDFIEDYEEPNSDDKNLLNKAYFLINILADANDIETIKWIEDKCSNFMQQALESLGQKIDRDREIKRQRDEIERIKIEDKQNRRFQRLRMTLKNTLYDVNEILPVPINSENTEMIIQQAIPSRVTTYGMAEKKLKNLLEYYLGNKDQISFIIGYWRKFYNSYI